MKFLCDNCKAKYQIADEKVAGKTVRMKCRKCGHQIEVRAAVTETSVSTAPPKPGPAPPPKPPMRAPGGGLATSLSATKPRAPTHQSVAPPSSLASAFKSNVEAAPASTAQPGQRNSTIELSVTDEWYVAINGVPVGPVRISELRRKAAAGAVTEESLCWQEGLEEWRPIRSIPDLAALVREAAQGNRASLLAPAEVPPGARSPSMPSAPRQPTASAQRLTPAPPAPEPRTAPAPPPPPPRQLAPSAPGGLRSNVVPLRPAASSNPDPMRGSSEDIFGGGAAAAFAPSLTPAPTPSPMFAPQPVSAPMMPIAPAHDPFALPPPANSLAPQPSLTSSGISHHASSPLLTPYSGSQHSIQPPPPSVFAEQPRKAGVPLWFWPILVLALGFGGGVAFLVFRPQPTPAPVVIQMPATAQPTDNKADVPPPTSAEPPPTETSAAKPIPGKPIAVAKGPKTGPAPTEEKKGLDLGGLVPGGGGGPNVGPNPGGGGGGGGGLDQAGVERVVAVHRNGVKRTCWERGGTDQKSSVNVTISANVAPNGSVASTSSTGDDPVVAKCIESQVRTWQFPAPGSSTTVQIPFKFVRQ